MQSLCIAFTGKNQVELLTRPVQEPGPGEVLVQATKTLISSGTESICLGRLFEPGSHWDRWVSSYPFFPGYCMIGRVMAVGSGVEHVKEGDRVAVREQHQQYTVVSAADLYPVPEGVADEDAAWFSMATIAQTGVRRAEHRLGDAVVVIGLGLLGQLVVQYTRLLGARQVIAIDMAEHRLQMAQAHGATTTLALSAAQARDEVLALTEGMGVEVVYDVTGVAVVFGDALRLLRRFGRLVLLGDTGTPSGQHLVGEVITKGLQIVGVHDSNSPPVSTDHAYWNKSRMAELFFTYLRRGDMRVSDLITHRYSPHDAPEAYRMLREERASAMGVIFDWEQL